MSDEIKKILTDENVDKYRAIPFWSWNDKLEPDELVRQIKWMKENGFGGYFMHARGGLTTEYLSDDWFKCIEACLDAGDKYGMESWAYDENGWPSGFVGGKLLEDMENRDRYLTFDKGELNKEALVSYLLTEDKLIRTTEGGKGEYLNVYEHYSDTTADVLNPEVVDKFINMTHAEYKKKMGEKFNTSLKGFFTDEPQYFRWAHPYTKMMVKYFKDEYDEDILDRLGLMFVEKEGYRDFRYKYWLGMQTLLLNNFSKKVYDWCNENGVMLTGHYIEERNLRMQLLCCGGIMPFYEYEHIPGVDHLGVATPSPVDPKQMASVARQLGKKKTLTETFACCGWGITAKQLKRIAEWQYVNGVNLMCHHLLPYSEHGQRKRDYPAHFSWANPWVREEFKPFNDYFARLGCLLGESDEVVRVALFCPIRSAYFDYKRDDYNAEIKPDTSYIETAKKLSAMNIQYHIIDETVMEKHGKVNGDKLMVGKCEYDYIVFPTTYTFGKATATLMEDYFSGGGKMLFVDEMPEYLEGQPHKYNLKSNVTLDEIVAAQEFSVDDVNTEIESTLHLVNGKKFIYAVNLSENKDYTITFNGKFNSFIKYDIESGRTEKVSCKLNFAAGQSYVLFLSDDKVEYVAPLKETVLDGEFKITDASDNYMTLDRVAYSLDGINYSPVLRYMGVFNELLNKRHSGDVYLKYSFNIEEVPERISFLSEDMHNVWCEVNGVRVEFNGVSDFEKKIYKADISKCVKKGVNEAVVKINFYESDHVYYVLFGNVKGESLKNCLAYDTTIESCYLQGDFGVYSKQGFVPGKKKNILLSDDFYIGKKKVIITDTVKDGYPFFAGKMTFEKTFEGDGKPTMLNLKGDFCLCEVLINGKKVEKSYFENKVDISDYVVKGENIATVTVWSGNRNLLGPHHYLTDENPTISPNTFELKGTWKDGVSTMERKNYAFVRFGLFND